MSVIAQPSGASELHAFVGARRPLVPATSRTICRQANEVSVFTRCHERGLPVMLKGPTGCGKTRFIEHMAHKLNRPLVTIACHDDLSASDLTGRYLIRGEETIWVDGPLTTAARHGAICYLDEVVEARQDTVVVIHPLTDDRRILPIEKTGELIEAAAGFQLVISYNPGYQHAIKDLKPSTRQRFVTIDFDFPAAERRSGDHRARERSEEVDGRRAGRTGASHSTSQGAGTVRGPGHATARLRSATDRRRDSGARSVSLGARRPADRRPRSRRRDLGPRRGDALVRGLARRRDGGGRSRDATRSSAPALACATAWSRNGRRSRSITCSVGSI